MAMKIYTKTGDKGTTSLIGGTKVMKSHERIEAYGTLDELNSHIGLCRDLIEEKNSKELLEEIQDRLFTIGAALVKIEQAIDSMDELLEPLRAFILPGGHPIVSQLHIARCVCRRAERLMVALLLGEDVHENRMIKYINRLSDFLFTLSRYMAKLLNAREIEWKPRIN